VGAEWLLWFGFKERGSSGEGKENGGTVWVSKIKATGGLCAEKRKIL
jgi:hypothetical protein